MSRVDHTTTTYVCDGCGRSKEYDPRAGVYYTPEGWADANVCAPDHEITEVHVCPDCWRNGFHFCGKRIMEAAQ